MTTPRARKRAFVRMVGLFCTVVGLAFALAVFLSPSTSPASGPEATEAASDYARDAKLPYAMLGIGLASIGFVLLRRGSDQ